METNFTDRYHKLRRLLNEVLIDAGEDPVIETQKIKQALIEAEEDEKNTPVSDKEVEELDQHFGFNQPISA